MLYSNDYQMLEKVSNEDIVNGTFYIREGVTSIGLCALEDCIDLTHIRLPNSLKLIGSSAFKGCTSLKQLTLPLEESHANILRK